MSEMTHEEQKNEELKVNSLMELYRNGTLGVNCHFYAMTPREGVPVDTKGYGFSLGARGDSLQKGYRMAVELSVAGINIAKINGNAYMYLTDNDAMPTMSVQINASTKTKVGTPEEKTFDNVIFDTALVTMLQNEALIQLNKKGVGSDDVRIANMTSHSEEGARFASAFKKSMVVASNASAGAEVNNAEMNYVINLMAKLEIVAEIAGLKAKASTGALSTAGQQTMTHVGKGTSLTAAREAYDASRKDAETPNEEI